MRISDWSSYVCSSDRASPKWRSNSPMAAKRLVAAIDQGTTSSRCILFDENACIVAMAQKEHRQIFPRPGWVEHAPAVLWHNVRDCVQDRNSVVSGQSVSVSLNLGVGRLIKKQK